jgi:translation initiation factor 4A
MLDRGFKDQIYEIFKKGLPNSTQIALFSATWTIESQEIANKFMQNPTKIMVKKEKLTLEGIKQFYIDCEKNEYKFETLCDLYSLISVSQTIIYCNSKGKVSWLAQKLTSNEYPVGEIHGEMKIEDRESLMEKFRSGSFKVLITTDLLARGIDIQQVSIVINFDVPTNRENYIHRIGRSGRYGRKGISISFITTADSKYMKDIETYYSTKMLPMPDPTELNK